MITLPCLADLERVPQVIYEGTSLVILMTKFIHSVLYCHDLHKNNFKNLLQSSNLLSTLRL